MNCESQRLLLALEMVGDEGEDGVVAGLVVGLVAGDEDGEVFRGGEPGDGHTTWCCCRRG